MSTSNRSPVADIKFYTLLKRENLPSHPISVHILFRLLQVYRGLGNESFSGVGLLQQDTDISEADSLVCLDSLIHDGFVETINRDAFRLTAAGFDLSTKIEKLREKSYSEPLVTDRENENPPKQSIWKKDISLYIWIPFLAYLLIGFLSQYF